MQHQWFDTFFQGLSVELWHRFPTPAMTLEEADFFEQRLQLQPGDRVLDVACGDGRHAVELASRGYRVTGVDISSEFLSLARSAAASRSVEVQWIECDIRRLPELDVEAAYWYGNGFGYLVHEDTVAFLSRLASRIRSGGHFVLQTGTVAESLLRNLVTSDQHKVGEIQMTIERKYNFAESRLSSVYTFEQGDLRQERAMEQSVYTCGEIHRMLQAAGFHVEAIYSDVKSTPYDLSSRGLLLVARRL